MSSKRLALALIFAMICLGSVLGIAWKTDSQTRIPRPGTTDGLILIGNASFDATLRTKAGERSIKGRASFNFDTAVCCGDPIRVRQFNLVFPGVPQADISGRQPKSKNPTGLLGMSIPASEKSTSLRYDAKSQTVSGEIPLQSHFPQIDEIYPPQMTKDPRESDYSVSRTQRARVKFELKFSEPLESANARAAQGQLIKLTGNASGEIAVEPLGDIGGYTIYLRPAAWAIDIGILRRFEAASRLCIQPVRIRSGAADPSPTGAGLAFGRPGANTQWGKADVVFQVRDWMFINNAGLKVATEDAEEDTIRDSIDVADCIEIFFVENFDPEGLHGGGATWRSGLAGAQIISSDGNATFGVDLTHLAHELGHVLNMGHPGDPRGLYDSSTNTLMCPSGWHNDNPKRNSRDNASNISNPLLIWTIKPISPGPDCTSSADCGRCP
ncbi:MAG: hypothetical protein ACXWID_14645 [Pyrinomonadaceae bacterium]